MNSIIRAMETHVHHDHSESVNRRLDSLDEHLEAIDEPRAEHHTGNYTSDDDATGDDGDNEAEASPRKRHQRHRSLEAIFKDPANTDFINRLKVRTTYAFQVRFSDLCRGASLRL